MKAIHKLLIVLIKWIPIANAVGILLLNTLAYFRCNHIIRFILNTFTGVSINYILMMLLCSYAFKFCTWHRIVILFNFAIIPMAFLTKYVFNGTPKEFILIMYYLLAGITMLAALYSAKKETQL